MTRPDHNSEGRLIHPTAAGRAAFWRWFGDSKVVDEQGRPLVVYHGTAAHFKSFDDSKTGTNDRGLWGRGHYFSSVIRNANSYALRQGEGAVVLPCYACIKDPLILETGKNLITRLPDGTNYKDLIGPNCDGSIIKNIARSGGHDGVIQFKPDGLIGDLVAFSPTQIKSATGNRGTFDPADPVITNPRRRNPQRPGDRRTRFLANRVVQVVHRILTRGIASPHDPSVHVPRENLVHQARQAEPGDAAEVVIDVPALDEQGRPEGFNHYGAAVPAFTLRIGYSEEPIAGRHQVVRWGGGGIESGVEHHIYLNTRTSEIDRRRTGWYDLATPWKALEPRLKHSDPTSNTIFPLAAKVVKGMTSTLIHEVTHLIDWKQKRVTSGAGGFAQRRKDTADAAKGYGGRYYNDPLETNAFFQQVSHGQVGIFRILLKSLQDGTITLQAAVKRFKMLWPSASAFAGDTLKRMGHFTNINVMSGSTRKHLIKRAAGLYETMREGLRRAAKGKLRRNPTYKGPTMKRSRKPRRRNPALNAYWVRALVLAKADAARILGRKSRLG